MERRRIARKYMMYYTRVFKMPAGELVGHLVDITPAGAMLISEKQIAVNQIFNLKLEISADISDQAFILFKAKSVWCDKDIDPRFYNTGFELLDVPKENLVIIDRIIETYGFRENQP